jgi:hypothetical protein
MNVYYTGDIASWCIIDFGNNSANPLSNGVNFYINNDNVVNFVIPAGIEMISAYAFSNCYSLTSITIPASVTTIGTGAFKDCDGLTSIIIPDSVTMIGWSAFQDCDGLISATINATEIGAYAFQGCDNLTSVTIGDSVISMWMPFYGCVSLIEVVFEDPFLWYKHDPDYNVSFTEIDVSDSTKIAEKLKNERSDSYNGGGMKRIFKK